MLILLAIGLLALWFTWTAVLHPTRKCKKCKGAKFVPHRGWFTHRGCFDLCPRCEGKGREIRPIARLASRKKRQGMTESA